MKGAIPLLLVVYTFIDSLTQQQQSPTELITGRAETNNSKDCPANDVFESLSLEIERALTCGDGVWTEVASLDLANSFQSCPSPWTEVNTPSRLCTSSSCQNAAVFTVSSPYSRVCGRVTGATTGSPDAFKVSSKSIDGVYLDGVSITYGRSPRHHIWSFAAGHDSSVYGYFRCPCATDNRNVAPLPPSFVGENYFCASVKPHSENIWDGRSCSGPCCHFHSPLWFNVTLPASTSDDIEVRICRDSPVTDEDVFVRQLQLLVQ